MLFCFAVFFHDLITRQLEFSGRLHIQIPGSIPGWSLDVCSRFPLLFCYGLIPHTRKPSLGNIETGLKPPVQWMPRNISSGAKMATHFRLVPRTIMHGALPPRPLYAFLAWWLGTGTIVKTWEWLDWLLKAGNITSRWSCLLYVAGERNSMAYVSAAAAGDLEGGTWTRGSPWGMPGTPGGLSALFCSPVLGQAVAGQRLFNGALPMLLCVSLALVFIHCIYETHRIADTTLCRVRNYIDLYFMECVPH